MNIIIGCDNNGLLLKEAIKDHLDNKGINTDDVNSMISDPIDYPDIALTLAKEIANGNFDRGILICGTGIGMAMVANKVPGIRAAQVYDIYSAERSIKSNNAQIITFGAQILGTNTVIMLIDAWINSEFCGGRSLPKVQRINQIDQQYRIMENE